MVPDGTTATLTGTVTSIGVLPSNGGSTAYPVTVALRGGTSLPDGATATVALHPSAGGTGLVVPTSALTATGRGFTVRVDRNGTLTTVPVTVGTSGAVYTQVTSGLSAGQMVVIADLGTPLPTASTGVRGFGGGGGGGARAGS